MAVPHQEAIAFCLRDGREVAIRPIRPSDEGELRAFVGRLSPESRRLRFFAPLGELPVPMAAHLADVDGISRDALVVTFPGEPAIRGVGRYDRIDAESVEVAFTVEDALHGMGIATELLWLLAERARDAGFQRLVALVMPGNPQMVDVFRHSGLPCRVGWEDRHVRVEMDLGEGGLQPRLPQGPGSGAVAEREVDHGAD